MQRILDAFMNAYWLRPETAMWRTLDVYSMKDFEFESPSMDLGCGDGTFSFLRAGGEFDDSYDVFTVANLDEFYDNVDVYDAFSSSTTTNIVKNANYKIDVGLDHKDNLLKKADRLGLYNKLVVADANRKLPFDDNSFKSVFSNILYWLNDPRYSLSEIFRILEGDGKCCIMVPGPQFIESSFYYKYYLCGKKSELEFLKLIDRGRFDDNIKIVKSRDEWEQIITNTGFIIDDVIPHLSTTLIKIWDIGLRPIFPLLKKMTDMINEEDRNTIKREWIETLEQFALPIIENDDKLAMGKEACFYCFILRKPL